MLLMKYLMEGETAPEGTTVMECEVCKRKFALPAGSDLIAGKICEECNAKIQKAESAADLKSDKSDELKKALGE